MVSLYREKGVKVQQSLSCYRSVRVVSVTWVWLVGLDRASMLCLITSITLMWHWLLMRIGKLKLCRTLISTSAYHSDNGMFIFVLLKSSCSQCKVAQNQQWIITCSVGALLYIPHEIEYIRKDWMYTKNVILVTVSVTNHSGSEKHFLQVWEDIAMITE